MSKKDPAFLFYSKDWLEGTAELLPEEKGVFIDLLCHQHQKQNLPTDTRRLARLVGLSNDEFLTIWDRLKEKFQTDGDRMVNRKLTEVVTERSTKAYKNKIIGIFAALVKTKKLPFVVVQKIKSEFKVDEFTDTPTDLLTERLTEWFNKRLAFLENANGNENINTSTEEEGVRGEEETQAAQGPQIHTGGTVLIVPTLKAVWMKHRRTYQFDLHKDAQPLRLIGEAIAKGENVSAYEFAGVDRIKQTFEAIVVWSLTHSLYKNFQLSQFEKYFQSICENFRNGNETPGQKTQGSIIQNNLNTAQQAKDIVDRMFSAG